MEYLDVVNNENKVVGKKTKIVCHKNDLIHRGSNILIFEDSSFKRLLLQKRGQKVQDHGLWCSPGGHVRSFEIEKNLLQNPEIYTFTFKKIFELYGSLIKDGRQ